MAVNKVELTCLSPPFWLQIITLREYPWPPFVETDLTSCFIMEVHCTSFGVLSNSFFAQELAANNLLIQALQADVKVPEFWAGCRALGLVNKFVTGPFWRLLESEVTITEMNNMYQCCK